MQRFAEGRAPQCGSGLFNLLQVVRFATPGLWTQTSGDMPLMGTSGGDSPLMKFPYFARRARRRRPQDTHFVSHATFFRVRNSSSNTPQGRVTTDQRSEFW